MGLCLFLYFFSSTVDLTLGFKSKDWNSIPALTPVLQARGVSPCCAIWILGGVMLATLPFCFLQCNFDYDYGYYEIIPPTTVVSCWASITLVKVP